MRDQHYVNSVYDVLVHYLNADPSNKTDFTRSVLQKDYPCQEYRFQGDWGFGGKCRIDSELRMRVDFHPMDCPKDQRADWDRQQDDVNRALETLYQEFSQTALQHARLETTEKPVKYYEIALWPSQEPGLVELTKEWGFTSGSSPMGMHSTTGEASVLIDQMKKMVHQKKAKGYVDVTHAQTPFTFVKENADAFELRISQVQQGPDIGRYKLEWFNTKDFSIATTVRMIDTLADAVILRENDLQRLLQHGYTLHNQEEKPTSEMEAPTL
jgi:hypothetical protein